MAHLQGCDRKQAFLPASRDEDVDPDHPVRFLDAFVDALDLEAAGFERVQAATTTRPRYQPADLLKLYPYGYLNGIRPGQPPLGSRDPP